MIGSTVALAIIIVLMILPFASRLTPTVLTLHISGKAWNRVTVTTQFVNNAPMIFSPPDAIRVSPISHGPYYILVEFEGEQKLWAFYFHLDAGIRRKVDIYMDGTPDNDTITMRTVAYGDEIIYTNTAAACQTSEENPANLNEI